MKTVAGLEWEREGNCDCTGGVSSPGREQRGQCCALGQASHFSLGRQSLCPHFQSCVLSHPTNGLEETNDILVKYH